MELNSCLYSTTIAHRRLKPQPHAFAYKFFSFYLDLDEIDWITQQIPMISRNRFNLYAFMDQDHLQMGKGHIKENVIAYLREQGIVYDGGRIMLLTYLRTLGYVFNPVSFYFYYDKNNTPICVVPEIGNTFGEVKPFFLQDPLDRTFNDTQDKFYYISPFNKLDDQLDFKITIPDAHLNIHIDTSRDGEKILLASVAGRREALTAANVWRFTLQFPLVTLKVIGLIHWHAILLWLKKVPHEAKTSNPHLQKAVFLNKNS